MIFYNLKRYHIKLIKQSIQMSYDREGHRYDLPMFVINSPAKFLDTGPKENFEVKQIHVRFDGLGLI